MFWLLVSLVSQPHFAACGCLCVDGVPKTLCPSIAEAQLQPSRCPADMRCPVVEQTDPIRQDSTPNYFDAPSDQAHSCREVRIWDKAQGAYTGVKICDVFTS